MVGAFLGMLLIKTTVLINHNNWKFWEEIIAYSPLMRHGLHGKECLNNSLL
jgi:hypothetical protein